MSRIVKLVLWGGLAALALMLITPATASAYDADDPYWGNYWNWYDNDYRPFQHRYWYGNRGWDGDDYGYGYPRGYRYGYRYPYRPRAAFRIGPVRFGYWY